jgi:hypothetical protein
MMSPRSFLYLNRQATHLTSPSLSPSTTATSTAASSPSTSPPTKSSPLERTKDDDRSKGKNAVSVTVTPLPAGNMGKRKERKETTTKLAPSSPPPRTTTSVTTRPTTPTSPVQIPMKARKETAHHQKRHAQRRPPRPRDVHSPDAIPASVVALLAVTDIPRPRSQRNLRTRLTQDQRLTVNAIIERQQVSEKEFSLTLSKGPGPMEVLLSPPEDLDDDDISISDSGLESTLSTRTVSLESMPSLGDSFSTETMPSLDSPFSPSRRGRKSRPTRRSLEPISSPPGEREDHPLYSSQVDLEELDFSVFDEPAAEPADKKSELSFQFQPFKSAFKSNLTASLRALRSAARSISAINFPSIPPDDFLTRSLLTLDPKVPYTDERRPPVLEEEPSAELRRYLNPTTSARIETHPATISPARTFTASIQMQTYKVHRSRSTPPSASRNHSTTSSSPTTAQTTPYKPLPTLPGQTAFCYPPGIMRQREMRENSDFIRIAVMEMAMRKHGKLDDLRPGRARWALPPRKPNAKSYEIGADGVPARWVPLTD